MVEPLNIKIICQIYQNAQKVASTFQTCDILSSPLPAQSFRACVDKGTYDAISLNPDDPKSKRALYIENVHAMLVDNGYLVLTSCNWTEAELTTQFESRKFHIYFTSAKGNLHI